MMLITRATPSDLIAMLSAHRLTPHRRHYRLQLAQMVISDEVFAVWTRADARVPLALAGIGRVPDAPADTWFCFAPGAAGHIGTLLRLARATFRARAVDYPEGFSAYIRPGHRPGERMAAWLGFEPEEVFSCGHRRWRSSDGTAIWRWPKQGSGGAAGRADCGNARPECEAADRDRRTDPQDGRGRGGPAQTSWRWTARPPGVRRGRSEGDFRRLTSAGDEGGIQGLQIARAEGLGRPPRL